MKNEGGWMRKDRYTEETVEDKVVEQIKIQKLPVANLEN